MDLGPTPPPAFYTRDPALVGPDLLGMWLLYHGVGGPIVEVEAYQGLDDPASHAFRGPTKRNQVMFEEPGKAYVYFIYGNHFCVNVVAHRPGGPGAVLIRALDPRAGVAEMRARRGPVKDRQLTSGPGKLCQALGITREQYGAPFDGSTGLLIAPARKSARKIHAAGPRIGIRQAVERPLRFYLPDSPHVSKAPRLRGLS